MTYEICAILLTVGTLVFFIYVILTLKNLSEFMVRMDHHLNSMGKDLQSLVQESKGVAHGLNTKLNQLNPLFRMINDISETSEEKYHAFKRRTVDALEFNKTRYHTDGISDKVLKYAELATLVVDLWRKKK